MTLRLHGPTHSIKRRPCRSGGRRISPPSKLKSADASPLPPSILSSAIRTDAPWRELLNFRSWTGKVLSDLHLDIGGRLREAVPVRKGKRGREVFEEIERRRVDPGLLEQTAGNNYRARIFPLPANGTRRVVIAYQESLGQNPAGESTYRLALDFPQRLKDFSLDVSVHTSTQAPAQARTTLPLKLPDWKDGRMLSVKQGDFDARGLLELNLPPLKAPALLTQRIGAHEYFCAEIPVGNIAPLPRPAPKVVGLLWDASGSGRDRDHAREFACLDTWFHTVPEVEVRLVCLRDTAAATETFRVRGGNWSNLRRALGKVIYDGATSFDGLTDDHSVQEWILFSDGLINYGTTIAAARLPLSAPVHAVMASARADSARLRGLAARQGGEFANLLVTDAGTAVARLRTTAMRVRFLALSGDLESVAQIFPEVGSPIPESNFVVAGLLRGQQASIRIRIGHSANDAREIPLVVNSGTEPSQFAARIWAAAKIADLSVDAVNNREDIRQTSREFGIVTADTSLIVLETLEDYLRYDIAPPEELRADWESRRNQTNRVLLKQHDAHLAHVVNAFTGKVQWWEKGFGENLFQNGQASSQDAVSSGPTAGLDRQQAQPAPESAGTASPARRDTSDHMETDPNSGEELLVLSPFVVEASEDSGYRASGTPAGTRLSFGPSRRCRDRGFGSYLSISPGDQRAR